MRRRSVVEYKIKKLEDEALDAKRRGYNATATIKEQQSIILKMSLGKTSRQLKHDWMRSNDEINSAEFGKFKEHYTGGYIFQAKRANQIRKWMLGGREE